MKMKPITAAAAAIAITIARVDATYWRGNTSAIESGTGAHASSCTPSTVFVPITRNVTTTETVLYSAPSSDLTTVLVTTIAVTTTVVADSPVSGAAISSQPDAPYTFSVVSSSTLWKGEVSPASGAQLSVVTSMITISPMDSTAAGITPSPTDSAATELTTRMTLTSASTVEKLTTITLPATTSTTYSMLSTILTTTLTSTHYVTLSVAAVPARSSFSGLSSAGWNATSTQSPPSQRWSTSALPEMTTLTESHYYGSGNITTSTSTNRITTTLGAVIATTLPVPTTIATVDILGNPSSVRTITAAPVTVMYTVQSGPPVFSTSVSFVSAQNSTAVGGTAGTTAPPESISPISRSSSGSQRGLPPSYTSEVSSSFTVTSLSSKIDGPRKASLVTVASSSVTGIDSGSSEVQSSSTYANVSAAGMSSESIAPKTYTVTSFLSGSGTTLTMIFLSELMTSTASAASSSSIATLTFQASSVRPTHSGIASGDTSGLESLVSGIDEATLSLTSAATPHSSIESVDLTSGSMSSSLSFEGPSLATSRSGSLRGSIELGSITSASVRNSAPANTMGASTSSHLPPSIRASTSASQRTNGTISASATKTVRSSLANSFPVSSATSTPTRGCGEQGNFTMDFDDLPTFHPDRSAKRHDRRQSNGSIGDDITRQPPLDLRPYHHMTFSNGFVYAPQRVEPFAPVSQPNVAAFLANGTGVRTGSKPSDSGEIDGPAPDNVSAFWFDAFSTFLGCDNGGPGNCTMEVTGLHWDPVANEETPAFAQNYTLPPCPSFRNCAMTPITFPNTARNLSGMEIRAIRNGEPRMFFMDDMHMAWSNKTCDAGMLRQQTR